jgi:hypothetical protein
VSQVLSVRVTDDQHTRLRRLARRFNQRSPSSALTLLLEEKLREVEHPLVQFRDTALGRQPHVIGLGMEVWQVVMVAREFEYDAAKTARHLGVSQHLIEAAIVYREAYPDEIDEALADNDRLSDYAALKQVLPQLQLFVWSPAVEETDS